MEKYKKKEGLFALLPVIILVLTVFFAGSPVKAEEKTHTIWFFFENVWGSWCPWPLPVPPARP